MYIFELISKIIKDKNNKKQIFENIDEEHQECSHIFVPIDSTKKILACSKCGLIAHRKDLEKSENKNFFIQD